MLFQPALVNDAASRAQDGQSAAGAMTIGMVTNPRSGGNRKGLNKIREFLAENSQIHHGEAVTPAEVQAVLAGFAARDIDLLIVNGGDGTAQAVLTALYGQAIFARTPVLALLRAGTTSMLARDVGIAGDFPSALAKVTAWAAGTRGSDTAIHERPVLQVHRKDYSAPLCGMFFGVGAIPQGIDLFHRRMNTRGVRGELMPGLILARLLLAVFTGNEKLLPPTDVEIRRDDAAAQRVCCLFTLVSTLERLFLGLRPYWGEEDAPLHLTAVQSKPRYLLRNLPAVLRGRRPAGVSPENGYLSHNARRITLDFTGRFTLDGELFEAASPLTIQAAGPARFLRI
jgi:hypothetical protein